MNAGKPQGLSPIVLGLFVFEIGKQIIPLIVGLSVCEHFVYFFEFMKKVIPRFNVGWF